ncbi:transposase [Anaerovirgula multivorans]|nr:transposase [Anaerovirgula multivorans]
MRARPKIDKDILNIRNVIDDAKCYEVVRGLRWPITVICPICNSEKVVKNGHDVKQRDRQKYHCGTCNAYFDDLTGTVFENHHQPLSVWVLCLYLMGLNLSNLQIANELGVNKSDIQQMTKFLREGVSTRKPEVILSGEIECDEVYIVAGHKGRADEVKKRS